MNIQEKQIIADVIRDFKPALETLDRYDHEQLAFPKSSAATAAERITYEDAMLLYLVVKNHSFVDGNKRIAAFVFLWFLLRNGILYKADGSKNIADGTLVALTLLIAESKPEEKETMVKLATNLLGL